MIYECTLSRINTFNAPTIVVLCDVKLLLANVDKLKL